MYLVSFCNQDRRRRCFSLAAFDRPGNPLAWIRLGAGRQNFSATGMVRLNDFLFVVMQSSRCPQLAAFDLRRWALVAASPFVQVRDPHSLAVHDGRLYVASTGDNAVYELLLNGPRLGSERLHWRYPDTSDDHDDVHLNSLAFVNAELLVSAFGPRDPEGRWTPEGRVLNTDTGALLAEGVSQPHSLIHNQGRLMFCESLGGRFHVSSYREQISAPASHRIAGYTRGLAPGEDGVLIGVSGPRAASRSTRKPLDIPLDAASSGVWKLSFTTGKASRVIDLPDAVNEVYDLLAIDAPMPPQARAPRTNTLAKTLKGLLYRL